MSTPIGNLGDLAPRAVQVLAHADLVCCEDTRRTRQLLSYAGITGRTLISVHGHNEASRVEEIVSRLGAGQTVALVSDAGTPSVSDPGARVVAAAAAAGARVTVVPGPNAAVAALVVSGLPTDRFCFEGFLPRRASVRRRRLAALAGEERTTVLHESPARLAATLAELAEACGPQRPVVVARELTKLHEEVWRGPLEDAAAEFAGRDVRGEVVLVLHGAPAPAAPSDAVLEQAMGRRLHARQSLRDAAEAVSAELDVPRRRAYEIGLEHQRNAEA
ncbi:MAG: 16S rRNA (cytidine(1402)-2'-O)-methyltransferase [Acidimicrobiales bacterium]